MTPQEAKCFDFIKAYMSENDHSPSFREIKDGMGLISTQNVHRLVKGLEQLGKIRTQRYKHRSIEVCADGVEALRAENERLRRELEKARKALREGGA